MHLDPTCYTAPLMAAVLVACQPAVRGGMLRSPAQVPRGTLVASYAHVDCSDNAAPQMFADYVRARDGTPVLVERSHARQWLVMTNSYARDTDLVFQAIRKADQSLLEYTLPRDGVHPGRYVEAHAFEVGRDASTHSFRARTIAKRRWCALQRVDPRTGASLGSQAQRIDDDWTFDGRSFKAGDRILIEIDGWFTPATVLQAPGSGYAVQLDSAHRQTQQVWITPEDIRGRLNQVE